MCMRERGGERERIEWGKCEIMGVRDKEREKGKDTERKRARGKGRESRREGVEEEGE